LDFNFWSWSCNMPSCKWTLKVIRCPFSWAQARVLGPGLAANRPLLSANRPLLSLISFLLSLIHPLLSHILAYCFWFVPHCPRFCPSIVP
jgi:hypothetical protein